MKTLICDLGTSAKISSVVIEEIDGKRFIRKIDIPEFLSRSLTPARLYREVKRRAYGATDLNAKRGDSVTLDEVILILPRGAVDTRIVELEIDDRNKNLFKTIAKDECNFDSKTEAFSFHVLNRDEDADTQTVAFFGTTQEYLEQIYEIFVTSEIRNMRAVPALSAYLYSDKETPDHFVVDVGHNFLSIAVIKDGIPVDYLQNESRLHQDLDAKISLAEATLAKAMRMLHVELNEPAFHSIKELFQLQYDKYPDIKKISFMGGGANGDFLAELLIDYPELTEYKPRLNYENCYGNIPEDVYNIMQPSLRTYDTIKTEFKVLNLLDDKFQPFIKKPRLLLTRIMKPLVAVCGAFLIASGIVLYANSFYSNLATKTLEEVGTVTAECTRIEQQNSDALKQFDDKKRILTTQNQYYDWSVLLSGFKDLIPVTAQLKSLEIKQGVAIATVYAPSTVVVTSFADSLEGTLYSDVSLLNIAEDTNNGKTFYIGKLRLKGRLK